MGVEIYLLSATSATVLAPIGAPQTPSGKLHYESGGNWVEVPTTNPPYEISGTEYWGVDVTSAEMDRPLLIVHLHTQAFEGEEIVVRTFTEDFTSIGPYVTSAVQDIVDGNTSAAVASAISAAVIDPIVLGVVTGSSGAIVSGIGAWGDLRWSKIYGIPLDEWEIIITDYT
jgi:hypothetical protein